MLTTVAAMVKDRDQPIHAEAFGWQKFVRYCDSHDIGNHPDLWQPWWEIWKKAYTQGVSDTEKLADPAAGV